MREFPRIHTRAGVARTTYNRYDSLVRPLEAWLGERGVRFDLGCKDPLGEGDIVLARQPHFADRPADTRVFWGSGLLPDRIGNFVAESMLECAGETILRELCGHLGFISQFVDIPDDVVFTVEYSVRAAQIAVYELLGLDVKRVPRYATTRGRFGRSWRP